MEENLKQQTADIIKSPCLVRKYWKNNAIYTISSYYQIGYLSLLVITYKKMG
jgi:hypothetical protein